MICTVLCRRNDNFFKVLVFLLSEFLALGFTVDDVLKVNLRKSMFNPIFPQVAVRSTAGSSCSSFPVKMSLFRPLSPGGLFADGDPLVGRTVFTRHVAAPHELAVAPVGSSAADDVVAAAAA